MCTYCGSGFILLMCVQLYKQNRYRDTEIKGYVKGVESSSIYTIRAVMLCMSKVSKKLKMVLHIVAHNFLNIQPIFNLQKVLES